MGKQSGESVESFLKKKWKATEWKSEGGDGIPTIISINVSSITKLTSFSIRKHLFC